MKHRMPAGFSRSVLYSAFAVTGLTAIFLAIPAGGGPLAAVLETAEVSAAPEGSSQGCPRTIVRGDRGDTVELLQDLLNEVFGETVVASDGVFGERTETAVHIFQDRNGLRGDGVVGPQTWSALGAC